MRAGFWDKCREWWEELSAERKVFAAVRLFFLLLLPPVILLLCQTATLQSFAAAQGWLSAHPEAVLQWWLLLEFAALILYGLLRLMSVTFLLTGGVPLLLTFVSYYKEAVNGLPLMLTDFALAGEVLTVAGYARLTVSDVSSSVLCAFALLFLLFLVVDIKPRLVSFSQGALLSGVLVLGLQAIWFGGLRGVLAEGYETYPTQRERNDALSVPLALLSTWVGAGPSSSSEYSELRMERIWGEMERDLEAYEGADGQKPHIIYIMSESFFDITDLPNVTYEKDPVEHFHRLEEESLSGTFYSTSYSGGTGWVEMELFTGVPGIFLSGSEANTELELAAYDRMPSLPRVLKENGYTNIAFHAHTNELYNRERNYPVLGFDQVLFSDSLPLTATQAGRHYSDDSMADMVISLFEENRGNGPVFVYSMTMENHQPYYAGRYDEEAMAVSSGSLDQAGLEMLTCLTTGIYDADQSLGKLVDYFSKVEEPVILVFSGDHKPGLNPGEGIPSVYAQLGYYTAAQSSDWTAEDYRRAFSTDYLIWSNTEAVPVGEKDVGCAGMASLLLETAGLDTTPYFAWQIRTVGSCWTHWTDSLFVDGSGAAARRPDEETEQKLSAFRDVIFDLLYGENYIGDRIVQVNGGS